MGTLGTIIFIGWWASVAIWITYRIVANHLTGVYWWGRYDTKTYGDKAPAWVAGLAIVVCVVFLLLLYLFVISGGL